MGKLKESLSEREVRVKEQQARADQLMAQLDAANQQLKAMDDSRQNLETLKHELEREIVAQRSKAEQAEAALAEQMQAIKVFKSMIADRDFRIESLENDVISFGQARNAAASTTESRPASGSST
jgi:chromosome segregation ATPase